MALHPWPTVYGVWLEGAWIANCRAEFAYKICLGAMVAINMITIDQNDDVSPHAQEVEFALLLSRMINTVKEDPEQLRLSIYAFARSKLKSEMSWADEDEKQRLLASLETAITGVEKFSQRTDQIMRLNSPAPSANPLLAASAANSMVVFNPPVNLQRHRPEPAELHSIPVQPTHRRRRGWTSDVSTLGRFVFMGLAAGIVLAVFSYMQRNSLPGETGSTVAALQGAPAGAPQQPVVVRPDPAPPPFPVPSVYGVYALNDGVLKELDALSEQVPDKRVAMSTPVTKPSRANLPSGHAQFVVFRRDLAGNAPDRVDVRVVAKVTRELKFDPRGKATITPVDDAWSIRNISYEFRVRPIPGYPEMLLMQPENADFTLPPGRYVLVLKNQGYDFTVAGTVTEPSQCLERTEASNGVFYSDCGTARPDKPGL
jgi:hypothetical protein